MSELSEEKQVVESIENGVISKQWLRKICDEHEDELNEETMAYLDVEDLNASGLTSRVKSVLIDQ